MEEKKEGMENEVSIDLNKLGKGAGPIVNMLINVFAGQGAPDYERSLLYAAGLAGYACQKCVRETAPQLFQIAVTDKGKSYFFGDELNKYMFEGKYSVLNCCSGIYHFLEPEKQVPDFRVVVQYIVSQIGNEKYGIWHKYKPEDVYKEIKACWNGIYGNMIAPVCERPEEWPVLFGVVLENVMKYAMEDENRTLKATREEIYLMALECAGFLSKMNDESL